MFLEKGFSPFLRMHRNHGEGSLSHTAAPVLKVSDSACLGWSLSTCAFSKPLSDADNAKARTLLLELPLWRKFFHLKGSGRIQAGSPFNIGLYQSD